MKYVDTVVNTVAFSSIFQHCFVVVQYIRRRFQRYVAHAADSTLLCYTRHELCHVVIVVNTVAFNTVSFFRRARRIFQYRVEYIVPGSFQHLAVHTVAFKAVLYVVHNVAFNTVLPCTHVAFNTILHILQLSTCVVHTVPGSFQPCVVPGAERQYEQLSTLRLRRLSQKHPNNGTTKRVPRLATAKNDTTNSNNSNNSTTTTAPPPT